MKCHNPQLLIENILSIEQAGHSAGGTFYNLLNKSDVGALLVCLSNNNIKLSAVYIRPKPTEYEKKLKTFLDSNQDGF